MFEIVLLGTSASAPSIHRGLSSAAVLAGEQRYLVDCGEGTQRQILRSGIGFKKLNRILLTHAHLDHILGLGGLVSTFVRWESVEELFIWGGKPAIARAHALIFDVVLRDEKPPVPIHLHAIEAGPIIETKDYTISAFPVQHRGGGCFGYIFQERERRPFLVEKAEALGIPPGPERGRLVRGETVTLSDGRVITPDMVLGDPISGVKIVFTGDVARTDTLIDAARNADALVIEGTFLKEDADMARAFGHITAGQAAEFALQAGVKGLIITHVSRRYHERDIIAEVQAIFPAAIVARDLDHYIIRRDKAIEKVEQSG